MKLVLTNVASNFRHWRSPFSHRGLIGLGIVPGRSIFNPTAIKIKPNTMITARASKSPSDPAFACGVAIAALVAAAVLGIDEPAGVETVAPWILSSVDPGRLALGGCP